MLTIEQLGGARRRVELDAHDAPDAGAESGVELRTVTELAPGADRPVVQILGSQHLPLVLRGLWDDATTRHEAVTDIVGTVQAIVVEALPVRLVWGDTWRREGLITRFTPRWEHEGLAGWELEFQTHVGEASANTTARLRAQQVRPDVGAAAVALRVASSATQATQLAVAAATWARGIDP